MTITVFLAVLAAAALHASWNAIVRGGGDKQLTTVLVAASGSLLALAALPFLPPPDSASWPFIPVSAALQVGYLALVAQAYSAADMSRVYPLMRGTAPLLVALAGALFLGEVLPAVAWLGIAAICIGILSMVPLRALLPLRRDGPGAGALLALANAVVIAAYTLVDGAGVRRSGAPASYTLWVFLLTGLPLVAWAAIRRRDSLAGYARRNWHLALFGGAGSVASYGVALWAMTLAPVAVVAALRETSILFGLAISALVLRETVGRGRIAAACAIAAGAVALRLA